jgi:hypothetical protein
MTSIMNCRLILNLKRRGDKSQSMMATSEAQSVHKDIVSELGGSLDINSSEEDRPKRRTFRHTFVWQHRDLYELKATKHASYR